MAINSCYLCGCKLRKGVCTECGLDNHRMMRRSYRLNETTPHSVKKKQVAAQKAEAMKYAREYKNEQRELEKLGRPLDQQTGKKKTGAAGNNKKRAGTKTIPAYTSYQREIYQNYQKKIHEKTDGKKWRGAKILGIIYIIFIIISTFGSCISDFIDELTVQNPDPGFSIVEEIPVDVFEESYDMSGEYGYVERELSATGDYYEAVYGPGFYQVGVHIPEGAYTIVLEEGTYGSIWLDDDVNSIYMSLSFGEDSYDGYSEVEDVRLYEGAYFEITGETRLNFISENAQTDALVNMPNPSAGSEPITLTPSPGYAYAVGEDIPAGVYDLSVAEGWTSMELLWFDESGETYEYYYWLDSETLEDSYQNLVLIEGMHIVLEECDVTFTPSAVMTVDDLEMSFQECYL